MFDKIFSFDFDSLANGASLPKAPQFPHFSDSAWVGGEAISDERVSNITRLYFFFDMVCPFSRDAFEFIERMHKQYAEKSLLVLGVLCPVFAPSSETSRVKRFLDSRSLSFPVILDADGAVRRAFGHTRAFHVYLVNKDGLIFYQSDTSLNETEIERMIQVLLVDVDPSIQIPPIQPQDEPPPVVPCEGLSTDLYAGSVRGVYGNDESIKPEEVNLFQAPPSLSAGALFITGKWFCAAEKLRYAEQKADKQDFIAFRFYGAKVYAVLESQGGSTVRLTLDENNISEIERGASVDIQADGTSVLSVSGYDVYELVSCEKPEEHALHFYPEQGSVSVYVFRFA